MITLYFDKNQTEILNVEAFHDFIPQGKLFFSSFPDACITITGYTCDIGSASYNLKLGKMRAEAALEYLSANDLKPECIKLSSKGEADPAVPNTNEENREMNRRVTIVMNN